MTAPAEDKGVDGTPVTSDFLPARIEGENLVLRLPVPDDAEALFDRISSDAEVTRYVRWTPHRDVAMTRRVITESFNVGLHNRTWVVTLRRSGDVIGIFVCQREPKHSIEIGALIGKHWWGKGLATEAGLMVGEVVRTERGLYRVWATCSVHNTDCAQSLKQAGFTQEGRLTRHVVYPNLGLEPDDSYLFGMKLR